MSRIATGTGDKGDTGLADGSRTKKTSLRIEAYGTVDELNAHLGAALLLVRDGPRRELIARVQSELFVLGSDLAAPKGGTLPRIETAHVAALDHDLDRIEASLPELRRFILPAGTPAATSLHLARTVARRAERACWRIADEGEWVNPQALVYLNRLSDLLFLLARAENRAAGGGDVEVRLR
ncbi:MAG: cob(I)yrinic acid a,c-diamide adenosyltransferase [Methanobacteriota archaeon]